MSGNCIPIILATVVAFGCSESAIAPSARSDGPALRASVGSPVVHRATVGGPDACVGIGLKPGCDANFSLNALQRADGSVTGQWEDQFAGSAEFGGGFGIHVAVNCLNVIGNQAWVSGVVTQSRLGFFVGLDAVTTVVDNGRSANDPADEISFSVVGFGIDCNAAPVELPKLPFPFNGALFPAPQGQAVVVE